MFIFICQKIKVPQLPIAHLIASKRACRLDLENNRFRKEYIATNHNPCAHIPSRRS